MSERMKHAARAVFKDYDDLKSFRIAFRNRTGLSYEQVDTVLRRLQIYKFIEISNGRVKKGKNWSN